MLPSVPVLLWSRGSGGQSSYIFHRMFFLLRETYRDCSAQLRDAGQSHRRLLVASVCGGPYSDDFDV